MYPSYVFIFRLNRAPGLELGPRYPANSRTTFGDFGIALGSGVGSGWTRENDLFEFGERRGCVFGYLPLALSEFVAAADRMNVGDRATFSGRPLTRNLEGKYVLGRPLTRQVPLDLIDFDLGTARSRAALREIGCSSSYATF